MSYLDTFIASGRINTSFARRSNPSSLLQERPPIFLDMFCRAGIVKADPAQNRFTFTFMATLDCGDCQIFGKTFGPNFGAIFLNVTINGKEATHVFKREKFSLFNAETRKVLDMLPGLMRENSARSRQRSSRLYASHARAALGANPKDFCPSVLPVIFSNISIFNFQRCRHASAPAPAIINIVTVRTDHRRGKSMSRRTGQNGTLEERNGALAWQISRRRAWSNGASKAICCSWLQEGHD
jgi:hypothetical protein